MKISDETYRLLAEAAAARHDIVSARKDELLPIEATIEDLQKQIRIAKKAPSQDVKLITDLESALKEAESTKRDIINKWQDAYDNVNNPYKVAKGQVRAEAQAINPELTKKAGEIGKGAFNYTKDRLSNNLSGSLSPSFYRDVAAAMSGRQPGNLLDAQARTHKAQAKNLQNETANRQMEAQKSQQIADRNEYTEAGKVASMQNDAQNRQNIANKEGIAGSAAALMRQTNTPDVTAERTRQDLQRMVANERRQAADRAQQVATEYTGNADQAAMQSDIYDQVYDRWANANGTESQGTGTQSTGAQSTGTQETTSQSTETQETDTQDTGIPYTQEEGKPEAAVPTTDAMQGDPRFKAPEEDTEYKPSDTTGLSKYSGMDDDTLAKTLLEEAKGFSDNYAEQHDQYERLAGQLKEGSALNRFLQDHPFPEDMSENTSETPLDLNNEDPYEQEIVELVNEAIRKYPESNDTDFNKARLDYIENTLTQKYAKDKKTRESLIQRATEKLSDENLKVIHKQLSDCRMKWIRHDWDTYGKPDKKDFEWLLKNLQDDQIGIKEGDNFEDDTILKGYAENIRNYVYNYKPEAMAISPDNDPSVTHIGPMAQDIEKVNPACISKDENGIESVDTGRVAMMNAGAIGDIARSLEDIKTRLTRLEAVNGN